MNLADWLCGAGLLVGVFGVIRESMGHVVQDETHVKDLPVDLAPMTSFDARSLFEAWMKLA